MTLRLFIDQCVPRSVAESLRNAGHEADLLRAHLPINAKDPDVIAHALKIESVLGSLKQQESEIQGDGQTGRGEVCERLACD